MCFTMNLIIASLVRRCTLINTIPSPRLPCDPMNSPRPRIVYMECPIDSYMNQQHNHVTFNLRTYHRVPSERPPYFHARMARKRGGGGRINGSDRFCTRGAPPILISAPRP